MFVCEFDPAFGIGVMVFEPPGEERDFEEYVDIIPKLDKRAQGRDGPALLLQFAESYPPPNAVWRKRFTEARANLASKPLVALVLPNAAMRTTLALATWVKPAPFEQRAFARADEAIAWLAERRRGSAKVLEALFADALAKAKR